MDKQRVLAGGGAAGEDIKGDDLTASLLDAGTGTGGYTQGTHLEEGPGELVQHRVWAWNDKDRRERGREKGCKEINKIDRK